MLSVLCGVVSVCFLCVFSEICVVFGRVVGTACAEYMLGDRAKYRRSNRPFSFLIAGAEQLYQEKAND